MRRPDPPRPTRSAALNPALEALEGRSLMTTASQALTQVRHVDNDYESFVRTLELHSNATTAQYLALRDDALAISQAASTTSLSPQTANLKAVAVSLQLDRAFLDGYLDNLGWADVQGRLEANLSGLNVPQAVVDRTIVDMRAAAVSAGVSASAYATFTAKANRLRDIENVVNTGFVHFDDPQLYYTQHLHGFIRGGAVEKQQAGAQINSDVMTIAAASGDPGASAVLTRDVRLLEQVGSRVSVDANAQVGHALTAAFANGTPGPAEQAQLQASFRQAAGPTQTRSTLAALDRLAADAPAFFAAAGQSTDHVATLVHDVAAFAGSGGGAPLNPFRVQIHRTGNGL